MMYLPYSNLPDEILKINHPKVGNYTLRHMG